MGLIRLLAILAVVYLVFRIIGRFVLPWLVRYAAKKANSRMKEQMKTNSDGEKVYQDEKITIRKSKDSSSKKDSAQDDEYVDFEEVDD